MSPDPLGPVVRPEPEGLDWARLTQRAPFYCQPDWCRYVDSDGVAEARYVSAPGPDGRPSIGLIAHSSPDETNPYYRPEVLLGCPVPPLATFGGRRGYRSGVLRADRGDRGHRSEDVSALRRAMEAAVEGWSDLAGWWWPYLPRSEAELVATAGGEHCELHLVGAECVLEVPPGELADYAASLPSRQARTNVRRELRRFDESGLELTRRRLSECDLTVLGRLSANVLQKYGEAPTPEQMTEVLARQAAHVDTASIVLEVRRPGEPEPVGFSLSYRGTDELYLRLVGFDYDRLPDAGAYGTLACYAPVQHAQRHGLGAVEMGGSSWEAKIRRGARTRSLWAVVSVPGLDRGHEAEVARDIAAHLPAREGERWLREEVGSLSGPLGLDT